MTHLVLPELVAKDIKDLLHIDRFDHYPSEELYAHISTVRRSALGRSATDAYLRQQALGGVCFSTDGIDQHAKKVALLESCQALIFCLTEAQFMRLMLEDIQKATKKGMQEHALWRSGLPHQ